MPLEFVVVLIALIPIATRAWIGWRYGASFEIRNVIVYLFAVLAAVRFWYPASRAVAGLVPLDPQILAAAVFAVLFMAAMIPAALAVNLRGPVMQSVFANPVDNICGVIAGIFSGSLIAGALLMIVVLVLPGKVEGFDAAKIPVRLDEIPVVVFRGIESRIAGIPAKDAAHSPIPHVQSASKDSAPLVDWN